MHKTANFDGTRDFKATTCQIFEVTYSDQPDYLVRFFIKDNETTQVNDWGFEFLDNGTVVYTRYFAQGYPLFKYPCVVGTAWTYYSGTGKKPTEVPLTFMLDDMDGDGIDETVDLTITCVITEQEDVTVPAGTFEDCYVIVRTTIMTIHYSDWGDVAVITIDNVHFKPYIGRIKTYSVTDYDRLLEDVAITEELTSYNIAP